jgi:hypothetical protein
MTNAYPVPTANLQTFFTSNRGGANKANKQLYKQLRTKVVAPTVPSLCKLVWTTSEYGGAPETTRVACGGYIRAPGSGRIDLVKKPPPPAHKLILPYLTPRLPRTHGNMTGAGARPSQRRSCGSPFGNCAGDGRQRQQQPINYECALPVRINGSTHSVYMVCLSNCHPSSHCGSFVLVMSVDNLSRSSKSRSFKDC